MGETEFLDLSGRYNNRDSVKCGPEETDFFQEENDFFNPGRSRINDFKHDSKTIQKGNGVQNDRDLIQNGGGGDREPGKKYINLGDEKIVWVGAIFVFFGVLVFLIGFWLGKVTMKDLSQNSTRTYNSQRMEDRRDNRDNRRQDNSYAMTPVPDNDNQNSSGQNPVNITPLISSVSTSSAASVTHEQDQVVQQNSSRQTRTENTNPVITPRKVETKNVKLQTTKSSSSSVSSVKTESVKTVKTGGDATAGGGDYTIQVSAHTSIEKARFIEDSLRGMGYQSYIVEATVNGVTYYRVRAGKFTQKKDAETALSNIKANPIGKDSFIVSLR